MSIPPSATTSSDECRHFTDGDGYERVTDGEAPPVSISRLTAVAEYGIDAVRDRDVHHRLAARPLGVEINTQENVEPLSRGAHLALHAGDDSRPDPGDVLTAEG